MKNLQILERVGIMEQLEYDEKIWCNEGIQN